MKITTAEGPLSKRTPLGIMQGVKLHIHGKKRVEQIQSVEGMHDPESEESLKILSLYPPF